MSAIFPYNPNNDYYEKDVKASSSAINSRETTICALASLIPAGLIGSQILKNLNLLDIAGEKLSTITTLGSVATVAILLGGLCVTRFQLARLNFGPPLDPSNSLTRAQVQQILTSAKIKTPLISHLEQLNLDTGYARAYLTPAQREDIQLHTMTKGEIIGILERAKSIKSQREKEWKLIWEKEVSESEADKITSRALGKTLRRFSIEEIASGHASIKFIKYPPKLAQIDHLICALEKAIKGLDKEPDAAIAYIGDEARFLLQTEQLEPIQVRAEVPNLKNTPVYNLKLEGVQGSMRHSPTISNFDYLPMDPPNEIEPNNNNN